MDVTSIDGESSLDGSPILANTVDAELFREFVMMLCVSGDFDFFRSLVSECSISSRKFFIRF